MSVMNIVTTPELIRTNPAHTGTGSLTSIMPRKMNEVSEETASSKSFSSYLTKALSEVNGNQLEVNRVTEQLITDPDSVDIHDVTTAMAKAQMSLNLAQTVLDRLVTGWNEISTNR